jgi:hypothetical protein
VLKYRPNVRLEGKLKAMKISIRVVGKAIKIANRHLPDTSRKLSQLPEIIYPAHIKNIKDCA